MTVSLLGAGAAAAGGAATGAGDGDGEALGSAAATWGDPFRVEAGRGGRAGGVGRGGFGAPSLIVSRCMYIYAHLHAFWLSPVHSWIPDPRSAHERFELSKDKIFGELLSVCIAVDTGIDT
jgi:hypothetical protein